jgi:CotH protein.
VEKTASSSNPEENGHTGGAKTPAIEPDEYPALKKPRNPSGRRAGRLVTAAVLAAMLTATCLLYAGDAQGASGDILITEVVSSNNASLRAADGSSPDWIELYNRSGSDISLSGYAIIRGTDTASRQPFGDVTIPPYGYLVVYAADEAADGAPCTGFTLPREGETLCLTDASQSVLQALTVPSLFTDISYARTEEGGYGCCIDPTPGAQNSPQIETMEYYGALAQSANLIVSEVMPEPSLGAAWIELYNAGETRADLSVFYLSDSASDLCPFRLSGTLGAGEYALINTSGGGGLSVPFSFGAKDHGAYLFDVTGALRSSLAWEISPGTDTSVVAESTYTKQPTPGAANGGDVFSLGSRTEMDETDPVRLCEALTNNAHSAADAQGEHSAWAELCNTSDKAVSLSGYYLSDDANDPLKWAFPGITVEPGGFAVVFLSGKTGIAPGMHASFCIAPDEGALYLTDIASMRTDTLALPASADDISVGRAQDGSVRYYACPSPGARNAAGFASLAEALQSRAQGVYISEVCAAGEEADWIELYNGSDEAADLAGWYLSDDGDDPLRWRLPPLVIAPGGYAVVQADGVSDAAAPFGIAIAGETVTLTNAEGALIDAMETGFLRAGLTSGRAAGDTALSRVFFTEPTPGTQNSGETSAGYAAAPLFSENGLYHTGAFSLSITAAEGSVIYYTLDGSVPDTADTRYSGPVAIEGNTVVRAVAVAPGLMPSDVTTATYLFEEPHTVPVVCLSGEPSQIYTIFHEANRRYKPEYGGNVEYFETDGTLGISFTAGIKPKGRSSLDLGQNSVTVRLREKYGLSEVTYPFFEAGDVHTFTEITLRNSGEDRSRSRLRDSFFHQLAQGMNVETIRTRPVAVYVNGAYWGLYDLNEEQEEGYFEAYFGLSIEDIDMIDRNNTLMEGSLDDFLAVRGYAKSWDLSDDAVFAEFAKLVDTDACMDYLIINTYFGNGDMINQRFWHAQDGSVKWQPLLFDLDWCMRFNDATRETFSRYFSPTGGVAVNETITYMEIFCGLKRNAAWREAFINRFIEMAYSNFDTGRMLALLDETVEQMAPEMARQIARWHTHRGVDAWRAQTEGLREALVKRRDIALGQMADAFGLSDGELRERIEAYTSQH